MLKWIIAALAVLLIIIQCQLWMGDTGFDDVLHKKQQLAQLNKQLHQQKKKNDRAENALNIIKRDQRWVEGKARQDLGYIRHGEKFYRY